MRSTDYEDSTEFGEMECPQCGEIRDYAFTKCPNEQCGWKAKSDLENARKVHEKFMADHPEIKEHVEKMRSEFSKSGHEYVEMAYGPGKVSANVGGNHVWMGLTCLTESATNVHMTPDEADGVANMLKKMAMEIRAKKWRAESE